MKNFKWKMWMLYSVAFFLFLLLVSITWNYFENDKNVSKSFNSDELIPALIVSFLGGLLYTWVSKKKRRGR
jgi:hypothetical protein